MSRRSRHAIVALLVWMAAASAASATTLTLCNRTGSTIHLAQAFRCCMFDIPDFWHVEGWSPIDDGRCWSENIGLAERYFAFLDDDHEPVVFGVTSNRRVRFQNMCVSPGVEFRLKMGTNLDTDLGETCPSGAVKIPVSFGVEGGDNDVRLTLTGDGSPPKPPRPTVAGALQRGAAQVKAGQFEAAVASFSEAIGISGGDGHTYVQRGLAYQGLRRTDLAIQDFSKAIAMSPEITAEAAFHRGLAFARNEDYAAAIRDLTLSLQHKPENASALNNRCYLGAVTGAYTAALKDCNEALRMSPGAHAALSSRGFLHLKMKAYPAALADLEAALRIQPDDAESLYCRGLAKMYAGSTVEGARDLDAAKKIRPDIAEAMARLGVE